MMVENRRREWCGSVLMVLNDQTRECACPRPVGTRGGCGAGWGPGACPAGNASQWGLRGATRSHPNQDKHQAPSSTPPRPLSLQDPGPQAPQWRGFPESGVNIQQVYELFPPPLGIGNVGCRALTFQTS